MPIWGPREQYPMVTATVTALVAVFAVTSAIRPFIPERAEGPLTNSSGDFLRAGAKQRIGWRTLTDDPFREALRRDKPIFMVLGTNMNATAREVDRTILMESEVAERINRDFIAVRVDLDQTPEWRNAYRPLACAVDGADPGWQIVVLGSRGELLSQIFRYDRRQELNPTFLLRVLREAQQRAVHKVDVFETTLADGQASERKLLLDGKLADHIDASAYANRLRARLDPRYGGYPQGGMQRLYPWEWRFLAASGDLDALRASLAPLMRTALVNWLDGGFYRYSIDLGGFVPKFEASAEQSADMAATLALVATQTRDPIVRELALETFDGTLESFDRPKGFAAHWYENSGTMARGKRYSFPPRELSSRLSAADVEWLAKNAGLDPRLNPTMVPFVADAQVYVRSPEDFQQHLDLLRHLRKNDSRIFESLDLLDATASVAARLIESARVLGDKARLQEALALGERTQNFRSGPDDVMHQLKKDGRSTAYLGDYLAYADCALQRYLATGEKDVLEDGLVVLRRGMDLFKADRRGVYVLGRGPNGKVGQDVVEIPEVVDGTGQAATSRLLSLCHSYGFLFRASATGRDLGNKAVEIIRATSPAVKDVPWRMGSFYLAGWATVSDMEIATVGPDAVANAAKLAPLAPHILVTPLTGSLLPEIQAKGPGVYLVVRGSAKGPLTFEQAVRILKEPAALTTPAPKQP
ncbi:MAG: thioredoxin domain-containing protein [Fimbriimonadaceae bacterium]|nr:thioredoxin domain-containing protein [Fimbriimonadaceae bacterium]QYK55951.1 MAG: thioredoxin domain-containing protein [Fimbriimonadaceae bacterium]